MKRGADYWSDAPVAAKSLESANATGKVAAVAHLGGSSTLIRRSLATWIWPTHLHAMVCQGLGNVHWTELHRSMARIVVMSRLRAEMPV